MSKKLLLFLAVCGVCRIEAQSPTYPAAVVTDQQMMVAGNNVNSTLAAPITNTATAISVANATKFAPNMLVSFSDSTEIAVICSITGNVLSIGYNGTCPNVNGRGFDGTTATAHVQTAQIAGFYVAWHHNKSRVEIEAIEQTLGANLSNISPSTTVKSYGAKGDARSVSDAGMTSGSPILTSATANFTLADQGKSAFVAGAGAAGANLRGTILTFTDSTHVVLSINAGTNVSAKALTYGTIDTASIQSAFAANPSGIITFPAGVYLLDNGSGADGLRISGFTGTIGASQGASFICSTSDTTAGNCVHILASSGVFDGADIKYFNQAQGLPISRATAVNNAMFVETSNNFEVSNGTIEASTGSGLWITNSTNMFVFGVTATQTSADGVHCDDANCKMFGITTSTTIGDGIAFTSSVGPAHCGNFASNVSVTNAAGRGVKVAGACDVFLSGFSVNNTQSSGIDVLTDSSIGSIRPTYAKFVSGKILNAGQYTNALNTAGTQIGMEIELVDNVSLNDIDIITPFTTGLAVGNGTANSVTYFKAENVTIQGALASCVTMQNVTHVDLSNIRVDTCSQYGVFQNGVNDVQETNVTIRNAGGAGVNMDRAWWSQNSSGPVSVSNLTIIDSQNPSAGYVVGETSSGAPLTVAGLNAVITNGSLTIQRNSSTARFETPAPLSQNCLGTDANGSPTPCSGVGTGTVTSITAACAISGGTITASGTIASTLVPAAHNGNYTILAGDCGKSLNTNTTAGYALPQATGAFASGYYVYLQNISASSTLTVTTTTSTFYGAGTSGSSFTVAAGNGVLLASDGTNWEVYPAFVTGSGTVTSIATGCALSGGTITSSGTIAFGISIAQHNTNYTILAGDCGKSLTTNAVATYTVPAAGSAGFAAGYIAYFQNISASATLTVSTATSNFYGAGTSGTSFTVTAGNGVEIISDGTNWQVYPAYISGSGTVTNLATACGVTGGAITTTGTISGSATSTAHNGSYTVLSTDCGNEITSNAVATWALPQAGSGGFAAGTAFTLSNNSTTPNTQITVNTTTSTFAGCGRSGSTTWIPAGTTMRFISTGGNWALDNCSALTMTLIDAAARGVISDGTTDNATVLAALTGISGGTIVLPAGAVTGTSGFVIGADAITIDCQGGTIKLLSGAGIFFTQFHFFQHFVNCHYDGNSLTAGITQVLNLQNLTDLVFENNTVENCGAISGSNFQNCMLLFNITGGKVVKNTFNGAAGDAISVNTSQTTNTLSIEENYFTNVSAGVSATGSYGLTINGNHCGFIHNDPAGIGNGENGNCITLFQSHGATVNGNQGMYIAYSGVRQSQTENTSVTGNTFQYMGDAGIYFESPGGIGGRNNTAENNTIIDAKGGLNCVNTTDFQNYGCNFTGNTVSNMFGVGSDPGGTADSACVYMGRFAKADSNNLNGCYYGILTETSTSTQWAAEHLTADGNTITELRPVTITTSGNTGILTVGDTISTANSVKVGVVTNIMTQRTFTISAYRNFFAAADSITSTGGYAATISTVLGPALERVTLSGVTGTFQQFDYVYKGASLAAATCTGLLTRVTSATDITIELMPVPGGPKTTCAFAGTDTITGSMSTATATVSALGTVPGTICSATSVCPINLWAALVPLIDSSPIPTQFYSNNVAGGYSGFYIRGYNGASFLEPTVTVSYSDPAIHTLASNPQTATYQVVPSDFVYCKAIPVSSGTFTITLVASGSQPTNGQCIYVFNYGTGAVTISRSGQNINGGTTSLSLPAGTSTAPSVAFIVSDGTNYTASVISGGSGTVTSVASSCGIAGGTITGAGTLLNAIAIAAHNGNYTVVTGDCGKSLTTNTAATYTLAAAGSAGFLAGYYVLLQNVSASNTLTISTTTSTFYGAGTSGSSLSITAGNAVKVVSDGNNWEVYPNYIGGTGTVTSVASSCGVSGGTITTAGTLSGVMPVTAHNGNYTLLAADCGASLTTNTTATYTVPQAGTTGFLAGYYIMVQNVSVANTLTLSTTTSAFYGAGTSGTSVSIGAANGVRLVSDGTNWEVYPAYITGSGTVTSIATGCGLTGGSITVSGTVSSTVAFGVHNGNYTLLTGDCSNSLTTNTTATYTFPQAGSAGFLSGWYVVVQNISASSALTLSTSTSNFYGAGSSGTSFTLAAGSAAKLASDGTNWQILLMPLVTQTGAIGYAFDGGGSALSTSVAAKYAVVPYACTLTGWNILVDTGTASIDVWKIATGTAVPTVTNTIISGSSYPAIATGTAIHSTTLSGFTTTAFAKDDIFGFKIQAVSGSTFIYFSAECLH